MHEDTAGSKTSLADVGLRVEQTSHADIDRELGANGWIVPRRSGASRSFPIYLAWKSGCDYVITLDDDCLPVAGEEGAFIARHLQSFQQDRWFRSVAHDEARGIPYQQLGSLRVRLNHGLWLENPDLDGPTALVRLREPRGVELRAGHGVVPPGMAFPLCAMNVCYHRDIVPAAYNLLMGVEAFGLDRFDDIWSGLLIKRVLDYAGWYATTGEPYVRHSKQSSPFANLRKEAAGIEIHEHFWEFVLDAPLPPGLAVPAAYAHLASRVAEFPAAFPAVNCPAGYFAELSRAMIAWASLFQ